MMLKIPQVDMIWRPVLTRMGLAKRAACAFLLITVGSAIAACGVSGTTPPSSSPEGQPSATAPATGPTAIPDSAQALTRNSFSALVPLTTAVGYTYNAQVEFEAFESIVVSTANDIPGEASGRVEIRGDIDVVNTTAGRNAPQIYPLLYGLYREDRPACVLAYVNRNIAENGLRLPGYCALSLLRQEDDRPTDPSFEAVQEQVLQDGLNDISAGPDVWILAHSDREVQFDGACELLDTGPYSVQGLYADPSMPSFCVE